MTSTTETETETRNGASAKTATVTTLTAEVRVLMVGSRQVTQGVFDQLDIVEWDDMTPMGRVTIKDTRRTPRYEPEPAERRWGVGVSEDGILVRACIEVPDWSERHEHHRMTALLATPEAVIEGWIASMPRFLDDLHTMGDAHAEDWAALDYAERRRHLGWASEAPVTTRHARLRAAVYEAIPFTPECFIGAYAQDPKWSHVQRVHFVAAREIEALTALTGEQRAEKEGEAAGMVEVLGWLEAHADLPLVVLAGLR
jgi:hypothetical protein